jgi:hypothetical protein
MTKEQAMNVIKQALDQAVKSGVCVNIDSAAVLYQAFEIVKNTINDGNNINNNSTAL